MRMIMKNRHKKTAVICLALFFALLQTVAAFAAPVSIIVDGETLPPETQVEIRDGRVMLQLNEVFRALGKEVQWIPASRTVMVQGEDEVYTIHLDTGIITTGIRTVTMQPAPYISGSRTMVPLRFISELLGSDVTWDESARQVTITRNDSQEPSPEPEEIAEPDDRQLLTFDQAVEEAVSTSYSLRNRLISVSQLEEQRERSADTVMNTRPLGDMGWIGDIQAKQALLGLIQTEINLEISKLQAEIEEERISFTVKSIFHDIINMENDQKTLEKTLSTKELDLRHQRLKAGQGLISQVALSAAEEELVQMKVRQDSLSRSLENLYEQLGIMTGIREIQDYRIERIIPDLDIMTDVNITAHTLRKIDSDPYVKLQEWQIDRAEKNLLLFVYRGPDDPYEVRRLAVESEKNSLASLKNSMTDSIQNRYQNIRQIENQFSIAESELKTLENQAAVLQTQLELGMIIEKDVLEFQSALMSKKSELDRLALQHELLLLLFDAPYLAPDYLN